MISSSVEKLGQACGSSIIAFRSLQSVSNLWQVECCIILSIAYLSASSSECNAVSRRIKFLVPISWIFPILSFQTHPIPLNWAVEVHEPSTMHILPKLKACVSSAICLCGGTYIVSFALCQAWHSLSTYLTSSNGSLSMPLNNLSFLAFQMCQICNDPIPASELVSRLRPNQYPRPKMFVYKYPSQHFFSPPASTKIRS